MEVQTNLSSDSRAGLCDYVIIGNMVIGFLSLNLLLIPLFIFVLYIGYRQKKQHQSPPSHSDVFTYNIIAMEIVATIGSVSFIIGVKTGVSSPMGNNLFPSGIIGQMCFHCLTCVDRYLAVAHPITYLRLKERGGVKIRNIAVAGSWVISVGLKTVLHIFLQQGDGGILDLSLAFFFFAVVIFCSVSVLCVLIRPGPGEGGKDSRRTDQSKQRAFVIIMVIMGILFVRFVIFFLDYFMDILDLLDQYDSCLFSFSASYFNLPSSLV
ncbi:hypothetical protein NL108_009620, partial [Boleophthalmus pectinirostris]